LLQFFICTGEVVGRKKCQKLIHILQECGHDFGFDFELALYGAYSTALQSQLESFVENRYIQEIPDVTGTGFPTSKFVANRHGSSILRILGSENSPAWSDLATRLNAESTRVLEATSTIMFLCRNGIQDHLESRSAALKPHLQDIYDRGLQLADELRGHE